jgi:hypothetical protein
MPSTQNPRAHVINGGFLPGSLTGHGRDDVGPRLLTPLAEQNGVPLVADDLADIAKGLPEITRA